MGRDRRAADAPLGGRPSGVAGDRLARRLRTDVADVRVRLEEAVLRSDALLATGQPERAAAVIDEQHALLAELRDTLSSSVAAAMVEAEAESVLAGSPDASTLFGDPVAEAPEPRRSARATASALVSAVAALALLIVAAPTPPPDTLSAADRSEASDQLGQRGADTVQDAPVEDAGSSADAVERATEAGGSEARLPSTSSETAAGDSVDDDASVPGLSRFQALVDQFVATVVRAAGSLAPATLPVISDDPAPTRTVERAPARTDDTVPITPPGDPAPVAVPPEERASDAPAEDPAAAEDDEPRQEPGLQLPSEDGHTAVPGIVEPE